MPRINVTTPAGVSHEIDANSGASLMEAICEGGVEELLAICGGCMSCATCHVYVDEAVMDKIPAASDDEIDMLAVLDHRNERSRLSCQIEVSDALDGGRFEVAPEE